MKLLVVQETDWIKRGPHQQHHLLERMAQQGHDIHVIDYELLWHHDENVKRIRKKQVLHPRPQVIKNAGITLIRPGIIKLPILDKLSIVYTHKKAIQNELDTFKPDVVIGFGILNTYIAMKECKKRGIPFVYYLIDHLHKLLENVFLERVAKIYEKKTLKQADKVFVINKGLKDYCIDMGADPNSIDVIPAGVDLNRYDPSLKAPDLREKYGIRKDDTVLFFMGWIYEFSGMKEVAEELSKNNDEHLKLMIVGEGDLYEYLQEFRDRHELHDRLILTGKVPFEDIPRHLSLADICLLPAHHNDIMKNIVPIKIYEYMAMGKPVIATELPGVVKEFEDNNGVSYIKKSSDVFDVYGRIKNTQKSHSEKARKYTDKFDWDHIKSLFEREIGCLY